MTVRIPTPGAALLAAAVAAFPPFAAARAQTPPSAEELAAYEGPHAAAAQGDLDAIRRQARRGVDLNGQDRNGRTPLHVAAFRGHGPAAEALLRAGADPNRLDRQRYDAVTIAAVRDDVPTLRALLGAGASAKLVTSVYDGTALIAAAHLGHAEAVEELIRAGAPLDHVNNLGWTALMEAVVLGDGGQRYAATVRALVAAGANIDLPDREGRAPLQHARARGYGEIARVLEGARGRAR